MVHTVKMMENGDPGTAWMQASGKVQAANVNWVSYCMRTCGWKEDHAYYPCAKGLC